MRLKGKTAIVTGGARGFGTAIAERFAAEGAQILIADADAGAAEALARTLGARSCALDACDDASVTAMARLAFAAWGHVDILVNAAGAAPPALHLDEIEESAFDTLFSQGAKAIYLTARHIVPTMKAMGRGTILNLAATAGSGPHLVWHDAAQGWVIAATRSMATELAPFGLRVNALCPPLAEALPPAHAEDPGNAAVYLCSAEASSVTGVALALGGAQPR